MKKYLVLVLLLAASALWAQDPAGEPPEVYVIRSLDFDITGRTRPYALIYNGKFQEGERILGKENLEAYIAQKTQLLMNQRVLEEAVIEYTLGEAEEDGALPVSLLIRARDTWNFIILPYPQYDSNDGFQLTLKIRDYNFLGTMNPLRIDLGYQNDTEHRQSFNFVVDSDTSFQALGLMWNVNFDHDFTYTLDEPLYYKNITGISVELPVKSAAATLGFNQYLTVNETNTDHDKDKYGLESSRFNGPYGTSEVFGSLKIPIPVSVGDYGGLSYTPRIAGKISYAKGGVDEPRRPVGIITQTLGFGKVNWIGNYRRGLEASLAGTGSFYALPWDWSGEITGNIAFYHSFSRFAGFSSRLQYRHLLNDTYYDAGETLRGIVDSRIRADYLVSLNLDFPFRVLRFYPSELFDNRKLRFFDFELHLSPVIDFALVQGLQKQSGSKEALFEESRFNLDDAFLSGGAEAIVFPAFMRSLYLRLSVGYDFRKFKNIRDILDWDEIFVGMGHHY